MDRPIVMRFLPRRDGPGPISKPRTKMETKSTSVSNLLTQQNGICNLILFVILWGGDFRYAKELRTEESKDEPRKKPTTMRDETALRRSYASVYLTRKDIE
jgi:hypothetical protein